ncbi:hypothetical protein LMG29542_07795 [Paraburkholderia humisilvae]|uniref:Uncharacterized protein n=1 Tax=Paraburkholderia humisilvae TaxID=627669 RepID=A0A6J5FAE9_9BURK|nr:hypothetical protein LMG29542_07795 [Paraburkholderia humisilvae]
MTPAEVRSLMLVFNKGLIERAMSAEMNLHLGMRRASLNQPVRPTSAMASVARRSSPMTAPSGLRCHATETAALSRS